MEEPYIVTDTLEAGNFRELGVDAVFTLSSAKPGSGVEQLRDGSEETYWQSDGASPHVINIHFMERKTVSHICLFCNFQLDESYSAKKLSIRSGTTAHDLTDICTIELNDPVGWVTIPLRDPGSKDSPLRTHLIQVKILVMHQNGRDTHIRQLKVFGPRTSLTMMGCTLNDFKTVDMLQYCGIR